MSAVFLVLAAVDGRVEVELRDASNFRALSVRIDGLADDAVEREFEGRGLGVVAGEHVWLDTRQLRATGPATAGWAEQFDAMIAGAGTHGWVSPDGRRVRAHREPA